MSNESDSNGPVTEAKPGLLARWWQVPRRRWTGLGGIAIVVVGVVLGVTLSSGGNSPAMKSSTASSTGKSASGSMSGSASSSKGTAPMAGSMAPAGTYTTLAGQQESLSSLRGAPAMIWLVTTWCPVCQVGTKAMQSQLAVQLAKMHVKVVEVELNGDLGHSTPTLTSFIHTYAGMGTHSANWVFGTASAALTRAYDPKGEMDVYYLVDSTGHVRYVNSGPAKTASQILAHAAALS
ncbi:MAG TPA: redoxin family protein [Streptosporangiaceae bacterium]